MEHCDKLTPMNMPNDSEPKTFTSWLRLVFRGVLEGIGSFLNGLGIKPNVITYLGLIGNFTAAILIGWGRLSLGGIVAMFVGPLDALDGTMARLRGEDSRYGAFIDSVTDRYSEIVLYGGLLIYFLRMGAWLNVTLVFFAVTGSIMVSYIRARAEALQYSAKIGLLTRVERYVVLIPGIILGRPEISLWVLAILTHFTAFQRFWYVGKQARHKLSKKEESKE